MPKKQERSSFRCPLGVTLFKQCLLSVRDFESDMPSEMKLTQEKLEDHCERYVKMYLRFSQNIL